MDGEGIDKEGTYDGVILDGLVARLSMSIVCVASNPCERTRATFDSVSHHSFIERVENFSSLF